MSNRYVVSGERVRRARELRSLTQKDVALRTGGAFTAPALSQIERGSTQPTAETLRALALALEVPESYFVARSEDESHEGFFRSLRSTSAAARRAHLAQASLLHEFCVALEEYVRLPELNIPRPAEWPGSIDELAARTRREWGISPGPIGNVVRELERHGIIVVRLQGFKREVDAFSVRYERRPVVVLGSSKGVTARSRFDAAHELAHLLMHDDDAAGSRDAEREAHEFAAAFLLPADEIRRELPTAIDWTALMRLKLKWRVSLAALLHRGRSLGAFSEHQYVNAMKTMSVRGWRTQEPGDVHLGALESPILVSRALRALADMGLSTDDVAVSAGLPSDDLKHLLSDARDPRPRIEI